MAKNQQMLDTRIASLVEGHIQDLVFAITRAVRENLAEEIRVYVAGGDGRMLSPTLIRVKGKRRPRDLACIAPGCRNRSKGPRFHYLCDKHVDTPKKQYEAWRKERMSGRRQSLAI